MGEWERLVQVIVEEVDECIKKRNDEALTLSTLTQKLGYSEFYVSRKFKEISGMNFRDYLRQRKLAFALKEIRDTSRGFLEIALDYGFSSHEAFSRSFKAAYGITPSEYRSTPIPVILRTIIKPLDCYLVNIGGTNMANTENDVKVYFVTIPAHKYLHIRNYESVGYWDFWQKQSRFRDRTARQYADCWTVSRGNWTIWVIPMPTAEAVKSWPISTSPQAEFAVGESRWRRVMGCDFLLTITGRFRNRCR